MKRFTELLSGSTVMLFHAALTGWMFCLSKINTDFEAMSLNYLPLCAALLLAYYLDRLMLHRGVPVPLFAVAQMVFIGLSAWLFTKCIYILPFKAGTVVMNCIIYCLGFLVACYCAWMPTNENGVLMRFDALAVMLIILLVLDHVLSLPAAGGATAMCGVCMLLTLTSSVSMRSGRLSGRGSAVQGDPAVGKILLAVVLAVMAGLAALLAAFASSGMKSFFGFIISTGKKCINALFAALVWLYGLLERFMLWLSQFASDEPMGPIENPQMGGAVDPDISGGELATIPSWIYPVLIAIACAIIIFFIFRLRHVRVGRVHYVSTGVRIQKRRSGWKKAMLELLNRLKSAVLFRWRCLRWRKTAPALLVRCERRVEKEYSRQAGESGESFLRRLSGCDYAPELSAALKSLADCVERSFYSPKPVAVPADVYKTIRRGKFKTEKTDAS